VCHGAEDGCEELLEAHGLCQGVFGQLCALRRMGAESSVLLHSLDTGVPGTLIPRAFPAASASQVHAGRLHIQ